MKNRIDGLSFIILICRLMRNNCRTDPTQDWTKHHALLILEPFLKALLQFLKLHESSIMFERKECEIEPELKTQLHHPRRGPLTYWRHKDILHRGDLAVNLDTFKVKQGLSAPTPIKWLKLNQCVHKGLKSS